MNPHASLLLLTSSGWCVPISGGRSATSDPRHSFSLIYFNHWPTCGSLVPNNQPISLTKELCECCQIASVSAPCAAGNGSFIHLLSWISSFRGGVLGCCCCCCRYWLAASMCWYTNIHIAVWPQAHALTFHSNTAAEMWDSVSTGCCYMRTWLKITLGVIGYHFSIWSGVYIHRCIERFLPSSILLFIWQSVCCWLMLS